VETKFTLVKWPLRLVTILLTSLLISFSASAQVPVNDTYNTAIVLTSGVTCTNVGGTVENATTTSGDAAVPATGYDVWYQFTAMSVNPVINVSSIGANFTGSRIQLLSGTFGSLTNKYNNTTAAALTAPLTLTIGTTYYLRVFSNVTTAPTTLGGFNICITDVTAPTNDAFGSVVNLSSGPTCVTPVTGNIANASPSAGDAAITGCNAVTGDVWYSFTAQSINPVIAMTNVGASITGSVRMQVLGGTYGTFVSKACGLTPATGLTAPLTLVIGQQYYIRVYNNGTTTPNTTANFDLCITDVFTTAPANDAFGSVVTLTSGPTCGGAVTGNIANASPSSGDAAITTCNAITGDVWYTFTAQSVNPQIALTNLGASITATVRMQVLGGTYGSFVSKGCGLTPATALTSPLSLTIGQQYYIRVYNNATTTPNVTGNFDICITDVTAPPNDAFGSAVTLTSGPTCGGTVTGNIANATPSSGDAAITACNAVTGDVWYTFTAQSVNPVIALTSLGASITGTVRIQVIGGTYGSFVTKGCNLTPATALTTPLSLTIGQQYYIRVYNNGTVTPSLTANFDICITDETAPVNDAFGSAITLTSGATCVTPVTGTIANASPTTGDPAITTGCSPTSGDVWYTFTPTVTNPVISLTNFGANLTTGNARIQILEGTPGSFVSRFCNTPASLLTTALNLTIGTPVYIKINTVLLVTPNSAANFDICITNPAPPANDEPAGVIDLVSVPVTCVTPVTGTVGNATYNASSGAVACTGTDKYDVWYRFTAQRVNPTIALTGIGSNFTLGRIQVLAGTPGSFTSMGCSTGSSWNLAGLVPGQVYYIRVFSLATVTPTTVTSNFNICITDPAIPVNDDCLNATVLTPSNTSTGINTGGNLMNANSSPAIPGDCGDAGSPDVWYSFVASRPYQEVRVSGGGAQLTASGLRVQILTGTCGSFTSFMCNTTTAGSLTVVPTSTPFIVGQTYYVRVYSNAPVSAQTAATWNFNINVATPDVATYHYGKTYANITKGAGGGTIEPGDELEIRAVFNLRGNSIYNASYNDFIPANTTYIPGTLRILTNEGKIFRQWTDAADGDPGTLSGSAVTINLGKDASETAGGIMKQGDKPGSVIMVSFRINVNSVPYGTVLQLGGGSFNFNVSDSVGSATIIPYSPNPAMVYQNYGICTNTIGTNGILSEYGGTFGSGTTKNREASNKVPLNYTYATFKTNAPGDYFYGVSNNTSSDSLVNYSINPNDPIGSATRVFNIWDIIGDHTGATNPLAGNLPADVNNSATGGYMVVINAAYRADTAFQDTVRNLCPNTSYEYSAWFRNICKKCGVDSNGVQALNPGYIPTGPGDSSGVHPNLTFNINGHDYYTTGDMAYTGEWVKKGFTYRTGPTETEMVIFIRNNAPGGGGNDWAIDDIGVATCSPTLITNPDSSVVGICYGDGRALSAEVISYYDNFTYWIWEKSVDSGTTWLSTGYSGNTIPAFVSGNYEYTATGPAVPGDSATNNNQFRLRVASSADNLSDINCSFRAIRTIQILVHNCLYVLKTRVTPLTGKLDNNYGTLSWSGTDEEPGLVYIIEKSTNGSSYQAIATIKGKGGTGIGERYHFTDPEILKSATYYRVLIKEANGQEYTRVVLLSPGKVDIEIKNLINPFYQQVSFDLITPSEGNARITIIDQFGRTVKTTNEHVHAGITPLQISNFGVLSNGVYTLKVEFENKVITKRIAKVQL
jgi:hypothetical protein